MYFITYFDRVNIATAAPLLQRDLGLSHLQFGLVLSLFAYPYAVFQLAGGWLADRFGPRVTLGVCGTVWSLATAAIGAASSFWTLGLARFALGAGEGAAFPTATRAMSNWMRKTELGFAQGITHTASRLGNAAAPVLVVALLQVTSWRGAFITMGVVSAAWVLLWVWRFRDAPSEHEARFENAATMPVPVRPRPIPWTRLFRRMFPLTVVAFCYAWTVWVYLNWIPSYFVSNFGFDLKKSALFTTGVLLAGVVGDTAGGVLSDWLLKRTGSLIVARRNLMLVGLAGCFLALCPIVFLKDARAALVCLSLAFLFGELIVAPIWVVPMDIAPRYAASASGMMNFGFGVAGIVSPVAFGLIVDRTGNWGFPFISSLLLLLIGATVVFFLRPDRAFAEDEVAAGVEAADLRA
ncbi:MAG: MFS transporter [Gammaproteobacteria bacterium]